VQAAHDGAQLVAACAAAACTLVLLLLLVAALASLVSGGCFIAFRLAGASGSGGGSVAGRGWQSAAAGRHDGEGALADVHRHLLLRVQAR